MTFDGTKLGVPVTMGSKAGAPAKGQPFKVSSGSLWVLWGAVPVKKPSLREPLGSQLVGGQSIEDVKITVGSRWYDVLVSVVTLGLVTPRTVTLEGVIVGDPSANLPGADYDAGACAGARRGRRRRAGHDADGRRTIPPRRHTT